MRTMFVGRGGGKTYQAIQEAAAAQDEGAECVVFIVPTEDHVDYLFPEIEKTLDMSRVEVWPSRIILNFAGTSPELRAGRGWTTKKRRFRTYSVPNPQHVIIDNADMIPVPLYHAILKHFGDAVRFVTGRSVPGTWQHDLTPWGNPGKVQS